MHLLPRISYVKNCLHRVSFIKIMSTASQVAGTSDKDGAKSGMYSSGAFVRGVSGCRNWLGSDEYPAESGRYHLYVGINCPWSHRAILARSMLGLQNSITMDICFPSRTDDEDAQGRTGLWQFAPDGVTTRNGRNTSFPECTDETVCGGKKTIVEIYEEFGLTEKSVPVLFDKKTHTIVNNESAEIVRMLGLHAAALGSTHTGDVPNLYPERLRKAIDETSDWIYHDINNGAYKAGFSGSQDAYEEAYHRYFAALSRLNDILTTQTFVAGDVVTESDLRLFPTMFRHDPIYYSRFKLTKAMLWEYPAVWRWMGTMIGSVSGVEESATKSILQHCKQGYFGRHGSNTIPIGPEGYPECFLRPHSTHKDNNDDTTSPNRKRQAIA